MVINKRGMLCKEKIQRERHGIYMAIEHLQYRLVRLIDPDRIINA
jgi:hypothetical protein